MLCPQCGKPSRIVDTHAVPFGICHRRECDKHIFNSYEVDQRLFYRLARTAVKSREFFSMYESHLRDQFDAFVAVKPKEEKKPQLKLVSNFVTSARVTPSWPHEKYDEDGIILPAKSVS